MGSYLSSKGTGFARYKARTKLSARPRHLFLMGSEEIPRDLMDRSAQGVLTSTAAPSIIAGIAGKALSFNASTNFLTTPGNFSYSGAGTVVAFVQPNTSPSANSCLTGTSFNDNRLCVTTSGFVEYRVIGGGGNNVTSTAGIAVGRPAILAGGYDGTDIFVYRNREVTTLANTSTPTANDNLIIGARADGASFFYDGDMYWWAYFDVRLTFGELLSLEDDPYQLFEQANVIDYFVSSAAAVSIPLGTHGLLGVGR